MTSAIETQPVRHAVTVRASQARAFETFTAGFGRWWRRTGNGIGKSPFKTGTIEPFAGGRWYEVGEDGVETDWGKVLAWEPNHRVLLAWQIGADWRYDPALITEVEVRFIAAGPLLTRVELEHRHLDRIGEHAGRFRDQVDRPTGWMDKLEKFAAEVSAEA